MFNQASRRSGAHALKAIQHPPFPRSISSTTRPKPSINNAFRTSQKTPSQHQQITPRLQQTRAFSRVQRMRLGLREASRGIWRKNPIVLPLAVLCVLGSVAFFIYVSYMEVTVVRPQYVKYPAPVADALRTAIYYTEVDLNPPKALAAYKEALRLAKECKMHPFSDEVLGIRIQVSFMLEKGGLTRQAIEVLERLKADCLGFVGAQEKRGPSFPKLQGEDALELERRMPREPIPLDSPKYVDAAAKAREIRHYEERQRTVALKKVVGINLKLAELYSIPYVSEPKKAEACQEQGVELCLKEMQRRQRQGIPVGVDDASNENDAWLNLSEMAFALVELASTYQDQRKDELALPLLFRALDLVRAEEAGNPSCKQSVLLNNIANSMIMVAELPRPPREPALPPGRAIEAARQWALKALEVAGSVKPPVRDEQCDDTCLTALHNLGVMAENQGKLGEAREYLERCKAMAQSLGSDEGVYAADEALERLSRPPPPSPTGKDS
ncbi:TPR domain protein [Aspergillus sp. HF37]|nr:TPR domain protein [Aspergillus sp. HF37]